MNSQAENVTLDDQEGSRPYHSICAATVVGTALLIGAGALVTTTSSGLSVPDWPTTFGTFFPPLERWVNGVEFEHTHRLIAGVVGLMVLVAGVWVVRREKRRGVRLLAVAAVAAVLIQGVLGGLTVLLKLPTAVSASHGTLAQTFFGMIVGLTIVTSAAWMKPKQKPVEFSSLILQFLAVMTTLAIWVQLIIGAVMRHLHAGTAIPDFPTSYGFLVPPHFDTGIAINFAHRVGALIIFLLTAALLGHVLARFRHDPQLRASALRFGGLVALQVVLGAYTVWTGRDTVVTSLHVLNGALVLVSSLALTMWAFRLYGSGLPSQDHGPGCAPSPHVSPVMQGALP